MKKWTAWLLFICLMTSLLSGCGGKTPAASQPESAPSIATEVSEPAPAPEVAPAEESTAEAAESVQESVVEAPPEFVEVALPIVSEPETFSLWYTFPPVLTNFIDGPGDPPFCQGAGSAHRYPH